MLFYKSYQICSSTNGHCVNARFLLATPLEELQASCSLTLSLGRQKTVTISKCSVTNDSSQDRQTTKKNVDTSQIWVYVQLSVKKTGFEANCDHQDLELFQIPTIQANLNDKVIFWKTTNSLPKLSKLDTTSLLPSIFLWKTLCLIFHFQNRTVSPPGQGKKRNNICGKNSTAVFLSIIPP